MVGKDTRLKQQPLHSITPVKWPFQACHSFQVTERIYFFGLPSCCWLWCCLIKPLVITRCLVIAVLAVGAGFLQQRSVLRITAASDPPKSMVHLPLSATRMHFLNAFSSATLSPAMLLAFCLRGACTARRLDAWLLLDYSSGLG